MEFEFSVPGVPRAYRARSCPAWQRHVRAAAAVHWKNDVSPYNEELSAVLVYFHFNDTAIDLDNMAKPILDCLKGLVYADDRLIAQLIVRRTRLVPGLDFIDPSPVLADALAAAWETDNDFVYVKVVGAPDHRIVP